MLEVHYELVKLKRNVAWERGRKEAEVLLQALLAYATTNQLAKYEELLKETVKLSPKKWLPVLRAREFYREAGEGCTEQACDRCNWIFWKR